VDVNGGGRPYSYRWGKRFLLRTMGFRFFFY
jgi:hypothetical protein